MSAGGVASATAVGLPAAERRPRARLVDVMTDTLVIAERNLINYVRIPEALFFSSVQPIMFVLLFRYVFGGAIQVSNPGGYVDFLIPGIFVQTVAFGAVGTAIGLAEDLQKGLVERFRSLPMARPAVLAGRTVADLCRNVVVAGLITGVSFLVGFRIHQVDGFFAGVGIFLLFSYALSWGFAAIGLSAPNSETAQVMSFPVLFPLTFASSAFVPVSSMPGWLQAFAKYQPVSEVTDAVRGLMVGYVPNVSTHVLAALAWCVGFLLVLAPLAVRSYRRST